MGSVVAYRSAVLIVVVAACAAAGCASRQRAAAPTGDDAAAVDTRPDALSAGGLAEPGGSEIVADPCEQEDTEGWLDSTQEWVYEATCRTAAWFDGFFGDARYDDATGETHGRVGLSGFWDQRDGFDPSLRFRAKFALPAVRNRADVMIGRGDEEELVDERTNKFDTIPGNFNRIDDDSFLVGLGFTGRKRSGFKLSVGAKIRAPPEPYVKLRYRKHFALTESTMFSFRPIGYWKTEEHFGATLHLDLDQMLNERMMLRWANYGNVAEKEVEGLEWESSLFLFQALSDKRAVTYRALINGETKAEETLNNYGFEIRYRQRVLREWLFVELITGLTWPKYLATEEREANIGIGAGFEMYFGPVPEDRMY